MVAQVQAIKQADSKKSDLFWSVWPPEHQLVNQCLHAHYVWTCFYIIWNFFSPPPLAALPHAAGFLPPPVKFKRKASGVTYWINTQRSILSMQIEIEVLHLPVDFRKAWWMTWYMHPFPLAISFLWKDDSYITVSQKFEANTWQPSSIFFFFTEKRKSGILQTSQNSLYFPCCLCSLCCYPLKAQYDPQHFVVIFNVKYPFRDYLMLLTVYSLLRQHGSL